MMAEQMVITSTSDIGNDCRGMLKNKLQKILESQYLVIFWIALIISLCLAVIRVLHEKNKTTHVDCVLIDVKNVHIWISTNFPIFFYNFVNLT